MEYHPVSILALRAGYKTMKNPDLGGLTGVSGGMGINLGKFNFDYSFTPFGDLGISHRVSLLIRFSRI